MANVALGGPVEIAFRDFVLSPPVIGEATFTATEGERSRETLGGTFTVGSGTIDECSLVIPVFAPSMDWIGKNILRSRYNEGAAELPGNVIWNSDTCASVDAGPANIHFICENNDNNDVHLYNAVLRVNFELTYNQSDFVSAEITLHGNPDASGNVWRWGTGDLTQESIYDPETGNSIPVTSP